MGSYCRIAVAASREIKLSQHKSLLTEFGAPVVLNTSWVYELCQEKVEYNYIQVRTK